MPGILPLFALIALLSTMLTGCSGSEGEAGEDNTNNDNDGTGNKNTENDVIEKIKNEVRGCEAANDQNCVHGALVQCTSALDETEAVHIKKMIDGKSIKVADFELLNDGDITRAEKFEKGCLFSPDKKCFLDNQEKYIEGKVWQDHNQEIKDGPDNWALNVNDSYMICNYGEGFIFFKDAGQEFKDALNFDTDRILVDDSEIDNLRIKFNELLELGGIEAVQRYMDRYYTPEIWDYLKMVGVREGSSNFDSESKSGTYIGLYQIGPGVFKDIGWMENKGDVNDWADWTETANLYGVKSVDDYKKNETAQHVAMTLYIRYNYMVLRKNEITTTMQGTTISGMARVKGDNGEYIKENEIWKKEIKEIEVTRSGLLAGAHLVGANDIIKEFDNHGNWLDLRDGNGTYATEYIDEFGGYNIDKILGYTRNDNEVGID